MVGRLLTDNIHKHFPNYLVREMFTEILTAESDSLKICNYLLYIFSAVNCCTNKRRGI